MKTENLLPHLFEAAYIVDENRKIIYWNEISEKITGYKSEEVVGKYCYQNILRHVTDTGIRLCHQGCPLLNSIETKTINISKVYLHHKDGYRVPVTVKTIPYYDENDHMFKAIEVFTDMQDEKTLFKENKTLKREVLTDKLTQVYNRGFLDYQINTCIKEFNTFKTRFAILFLDIDFFKKVNDTYGHDAGDKVLTKIAKTISLNIRKNDFVGRYGGEEFVVILRDISEESMIQIAEKIRILIRGTDILFDDKLINVTVSIGCSYYREGLSQEEFLKEADANMYKAKETGRDKVVTNEKTN